MGYIHCCSGLRKSKSYSLIPDEKYLFAQVDFLEQCPVCGHTVLQLTRMDFENKISICRKVNQKARKLFENLKANFIQTNITKCVYGINSHSKFYLNYNEFGKKKKCYSNLRTLKIGLFENKEISNIKNF